MSVKYGLIGFGGWGNLHAHAIRKIPNAELVAIAVSSSASKQKVKKDLQNVKVYSNYEQLLARPDIDIVDIVTPNYLHYEITVKSLRSGKHVLLEKPMALTVEQCEHIISVEQKQGKKIHIGHELRFSPLWETVKHYIERGKIGNLKSVQINLSRHPYRSGSNGWRKDSSKVGNWILEEPVHFYDLVRWYFEGFEEPISIYAQGNSRDKELEQRKLYENLITTITFSKGGYGVVSQTLAAYEHHLDGLIIGTNGAIKVHWSGATDRIRQPKFSMEYFDGHQKQKVAINNIPGELYELEYQLRAVTDMVRNDSTPVISSKDGLWSVKLSLASQESIIEKKIINFL